MLETQGATSALALMLIRLMTEDSRTPAWVAERLGLDAKEMIDVLESNRIVAFLTAHHCGSSGADGVANFGGQ